MNIYFFKRDNYSYDEVTEQLIVANSPKEAEENITCGEEGFEEWENIKPKFISKYTGRKKTPFILMVNYNNA